MFCSATCGRDVLRAERRAEKKDKPEDEDDLALVRDRANRAKRTTSVERPAALGENHSIQTQDAPFKATSLRRYLNPKSLVGQGTVDPFQSFSLPFDYYGKFLDRLLLGNPSFLIIHRNAC
jgi:hypothetical protein